MNERLVKGREDIFFGNEFDISAGTKLPDDVVNYYVEPLAPSPDALRGSFGFYRAFDTTTAQNQERTNQRLTLPVLAIGGENSAGEGVGATMKLAADDVQSLVIPGAGHWVAEEAPEELLAALTAFLAPYRDGSGRGGSLDALLPDVCACPALGEATAWLTAEPLRPPTPSRWAERRGGAPDGCAALPRHSRHHRPSVDRRAPCSRQQPWSPPLPARRGHGPRRPARPGRVRRRAQPGSPAPHRVQLAWR